MNDDAIIAEIRELEQQRGRALVEADLKTMAELVADDVVHIHASGLVEDKAAYLLGVETKLDFQRVERPAPLTVRVYGDVAVATGPLDQTVAIKGPGTVIEMSTITTQVWVKKGSSWVQNSFQATRTE